MNRGPNGPFVRLFMLDRSSPPSPKYQISENFTLETDHPGTWVSFKCRHTNRQKFQADSYITSTKINRVTCRWCKTAYGSEEVRRQEHHLTKSKEHRSAQARPSKHSQKMNIAATPSDESSAHLRKRRQAPAHSWYPKFTQEDKIETDRFAAIIVRDCGSSFNSLERSAMGRLSRALDPEYEPPTAQRLAEISGRGSP